MHPDHTGGNENFGKLGALIFGHDIAPPPIPTLTWRTAAVSPAPSGRWTC
jgi:glyoxylase-like metal-dependent hydrolase (beta-lactamase superfamily II)